MEYGEIKPVRFLSRPNRFIALAELGGEEIVCHVKNTGRCRELLAPGASAFVEVAKNPGRKTKFDLIAVYKNHRLINIDSQAPNKLFAQWVQAGNLFQNITLFHPETRYKNSRFDFYLEADGRKIFVEVKGVTLEENGVVLFPDAPTERGARHLRELIDATHEGYDAYVVFVVQMKNVHYFSPNDRTDATFGQALREAHTAGVNILAVDCIVTPEKLSIADFVPVVL
ncbi:MAG: DNA/RNA nuclease SfsA [Clostridia bacterium]|nr:DNA/RNA nuclease SfsA [Clostridia bacterium]